MNGYREQQSRQSRRSGRRSLASHGNTSVQSVTPSAIDKMGRSRSSGPSASQRVSVQPSVCAVQPGRVLELRTTLGLMRARAMLEQQIEQERQQQMIDEGLKGGGRSREQKQLATKGLLKHGRLQPLGVVSNPLMISNSCLGIVSVNSQSPNYQRPRSCTAPGVHLGNSEPTSGGNGESESLGKRVKVRKRSFSAMLPRNVSVDQVSELTANLSITQQTGLIAEEGTTTSTTIEPIKRTTANSHSNKNQSQAQTSQNSTSQLNTKGTQKFNNSDYDLQTVDASTGKIQILPPVVRQGELGMKVEVKRLKTANDSVTLETSNDTLTVEDAQETGTIVSSKGTKKLPKLREKEKKQVTHVSSQSPKTKEKPNDNHTAQTYHASNNSSSSLRKVSIVSLGETPSKSQQTDRNRQRRKRRHSEGKQVGSGHLSQGWSPPQLETLEPVVGSPLHTPRKRSHTTTAQGNGHAMESSSLGEQGSILDLEAIRSQMTSPGMFISVDVNEFLQDIDANDPA